MSLSQELKLKKPFGLLYHEAALNIYYTASCMKKQAGVFFNQFGLTDVQFNVLMLLQHQDESGEGLTQAQLSEMLLVNKANVTSLIDRMEKADLVARKSDPNDRRINMIRLTKKGKELVEKIDPLYGKEMQRVMSVISSSEQEQLISLLERIRSKVS